MKKKLTLLFSLVFSVSLLLVACGETDTQLQLGTGSPGGTYYPLGTEIANVVTAEVEGLSVSAVSSGASVENLSMIGQGEMDLGMTVHLPAQDALNGVGAFESPVENFGFMGHIYPEVMQVVVRADSGIDSIADLAGKRVAIGPAGSGTQDAATLILEAYGVEDGDYTPFAEGFGNAAGQLQDGNIDALFGLLGLPASAVTELALNRDIKILDVEGDALDYILENSGYGHLEIPADAYDFLDAPVSTVTAYAVLVGSLDSVDEDLGYEITKAMFEKAGNVTHDQARHLTKDNALLGSEGLPFHPGAERYFQEIGLR
ncbi:TRAP transporter [Anaerobacillus arseniciselenatis]|uniref:TRAP transporter n=1 Tax=Anaerobacillus arseniciselenatis TaxID=85682 RepID=A0A1S2LD02_9BACI|nr:TAXI family TRAP transporter solute-binding subunit [Anaerobacillus arseniciselenatis]OIJ10204.1 TRAP transporter [Anaerobacillus arseniciselenatis]